MKPLTRESGPAYLFCPASRPDRYQKALDAADFAIFDLEDAVAAADKAAARQALLDNPVDPEAVIVRVNAIGSQYIEADLAALRSTEYRRIMVPKAGDPEAIAKLEGYEVIALCESARGVLRAPQIAEVPSVVALMWGAEDLIVSLGGRSSRREDGSYLDVAIHARAKILLAAGACGKAAVDAVFLDLNTREGLLEEARDAVNSGFSAKACIHPDQVNIIRSAFRPSRAQLEWATRIVESVQDGGVGVVDGVMIDEPLVQHARLLLRDGDIARVNRVD